MRLPAAYDNGALDRFWSYAEKVLGSRLGYSAETDQDTKSVTLAVGAVGMNRYDRTRLREALPGSWVKLDMFRTRYSLGDLNEFGRRAEAALREAGLYERLWVGYSAAPLGQPDLVNIRLARDDDEALAVLRRELPDGAFSVAFGRIRPLGRGSTGPRKAGKAWAAVPVLILTLGVTGVVGRLRRQRGRGAQED